MKKNITDPQIRYAVLSFILMLMAAQISLATMEPPVHRDCSTPGCQFSFHASEFNPSGPFKSSKPARYPNDYAKTFYCDAPWRVSSLDEVIPLYLQIEGTDVDAVNELHCVGIYDVSSGGTPPDPEEDFWGDYENTPDVSFQVYKAECAGCELYRPETGMYWMIADTFLHDGASGGTQPDGTALTARNMGYTESDLGKCITLTVRIIYEESFNWTDIHDQDLKIYLGKAPLPRLDDWYLGDTHTHTWSSYYMLEMGASTTMMCRSMQACGLHWQLINDHAYGLTDAKWTTVTQECIDNTNPGHYICLRGEECDDGYTLDTAHHFLAYNISNWIETYESEPQYLDTIQNICHQGGFTYGAHTSTSGWLWTDQDVRDALNFDCFRGTEDFNERSPYSSEDLLHPWGSSPHTGNWETTNAAWDADVISGLLRLDLFLSEKLNSTRYQVFMAAGTDAHGSMNYHVDWDVFRDDVLYIAKSNALGKVRTAVYCPGGLTQSELLDNLYNGRSVVTDGPMIVEAVSLDGLAAQYSQCDGKIGDLISVSENDGDARVYLQWVSSADYGPIRRIQVFRGDSTTGNTPEIIYDMIPADGMTGTDTGLTIAALLKPEYADNDPNPDFYIRSVVYTYNPDTGPNAPGDVSVPSYNPISNQYQYRAFTNPVWINISESESTPTPQPSFTPDPTTSPEPTFTSVPTNTPLTTFTPTATDTPIPSATPPPLPASGLTGMGLCMVILSGILLIHAFKK